MQNNPEKWSQEPSSREEGGRPEDAWKQRARQSGLVPWREACTASPCLWRVGGIQRRIVKALVFGRQESISPVCRCSAGHSSALRTCCLSAAPSLHPCLPALPPLLKLFRWHFHFLVLMLMCTSVSVGIYPFFVHACISASLSIPGRFSEYVVLCICVIRIDIWHSKYVASGWHSSFPSDFSPRMSMEKRGSLSNSLLQNWWQSYEYTWISEHSTVTENRQKQRQDGQPSQYLS